MFTQYIDRAAEPKVYATREKAKTGDSRTGIDFW